MRTSPNQKEALKWGASNQQFGHKYVVNNDGVESQNP